MLKRSEEKCACSQAGLGVRDYLIEDYIQTVCPQCFKPGEDKLANPSSWIDGMIVSYDGKVYLHRFCPNCGESESLYEENLEIWRSRQGFSTPTKQIIPDRDANPKPFPQAYSDGLPISHGQHTCILLLNITKRCNLSCPVCYATAGGDQMPDPMIDQIIQTVNTVIMREKGKLGVLMLSGGEPTMRDDLPELIEKLVPLPITRIMLNTNGIKLDSDRQLLDLIAKHNDRIEVYLQFDGFREETYKKLRGDQSLVEVKQRVVEKLNSRGVFFTLVPTVVKGVNDDEVGEIIHYGLKHPYCAGLAIQPSYLSGRHLGLDPMDRVTPTGIIARMKEMTGGLLTQDDFIPLPCSHRDCCDITYLVKGSDNKWKSLIALIGRSELKKWLHLVGNTVTFDELSPPVMELIKNGALTRLFSNEFRPMSAALTRDVSQVCDCIPGLSKMVSGLSKLLTYRPDNGSSAAKPGERTFRITVKQFMDVHTLNSNRLKQCCVHTGTFEPDPRRRQMCWRFMMAANSDFPVGPDGVE